MQIVMRPPKAITGKIGNKKKTNFLKHLQISNDNLKFLERNM